MGTRPTVVAILAMAGLATPLRTHAENIDFTFTGTTPYSMPLGTVSGALLGVADNGASTPTGVLLFTDPDHIPTGNLTQAGWFNVPGQPDTITLSHGSVTSADFTYFSITTNQELILGAFSIDSMLINYLNGDVTGFGPVTYSPAPVDEPASLAILSLAAAVLMAACRRKELPTP